MNSTVIELYEIWFVVQQHTYFHTPVDGDKFPSVINSNLCYQSKYNLALAITVWGKMEQVGHVITFKGQS